MRLKTEVSLPIGVLNITHSDNVMLLGSCFAHNMGMRLKESKFNVDVNPFGILYNPLSIAAALNSIIDKKIVDASSSELVQHNGKWHSMMHHGDFSSCSKETTISMINGRISVAHDSLSHLNLLMITFGTAYVYRNASDGRVVGNCHKMPQKMFDRQLLSVDEVVDAMLPVIERLSALSPSLKIMFTVSPIRHLRDGAHDNQLSKAVLLLAIDKLSRRFPDTVLYFPSYEILLDELRDYRFYADDMVPPSMLAQEYIWECFANSFFTAQTKKITSEIEEVAKALAHRPNDASSSEHHAFIERLLLKIEALATTYPYLDFKNEIEQCNTQLAV